ncbi:succinyl-coa synthetase, alpha subunit-related [hydrocarbon metagenome]|uniref:Succinyl-coa synthetase, alpha subunit-related n=1 Tax=hydrocarbon metagenome TaxID=938273 RepID=A0A0W8FSS6_9ZZZZ
MTKKPISESTLCFIHDGEPRDEEVALLLKKARTIAIVGLSDTPTRDSHSVALYMMEKGYRIIPVNPNCSEILGEKSYPDLLSIPDKVDIVDIFRKTEFIPEIVDEAIKIKAGAIWMQLDLYHEQAARKAREAGLTVIQSKCIKIEHAVLLG